MTIERIETDMYSVWNDKRDEFLKELHKSLTNKFPEGFRLSMKSGNISLDSQVIMFILETHYGVQMIDLHIQSSSLFFL